MNCQGKYRLLPDLTPEERESLKKSIQERGIEIPAIVDDEGNIVDGHHRDEVCEELGVFCPREVRKFNDESEKWELVLTANVRRRQLDRDQKRALIGAYLRVDPEICDNWLAEIVGGVSKNSVAQERERLETACLIDKVEVRHGKDGKRYPARFARVVVSTAKELETALEAVKKLAPTRNGKIVDATTAARRARRNVRKQVREGHVIVPTVDEDIRIYHCRFQELEKTAGIGPASVHAIVTDILYAKPFLEQVSDLAELASRILVPGGLLVTLSGILHLDQVMRRLGERLVWGWMGPSVWDGNANILYPRQVTSQWKPILIYSQGPWKERGMWPDVSRVNSKEKEWHPMQQPLEEAENFVRYFTRPGDLVVDPCGGGFTVAAACRNLGRRCISCDIEKSCVLQGQARLAELAARATDSNPSAETKAEGSSP